MSVRACEAAASKLLSERVFNSGMYWPDGLSTATATPVPNLTLDGVPTFAVTDASNLDTFEIEKAVVDAAAGRSPVSLCGKALSIDPEDARALLAATLAHAHIHVAAHKFIRAQHPRLTAAGLRARAMKESAEAARGCAVARGDRGKAWQCRHRPRFPPTSPCAGCANYGTPPLDAGGWGAR